MNKLAYLILNVLKGENATDKMSSMSVTDIHYEIRDSHYSYSAVYKKIKQLVIMGHCMMGIRDGGSNTYYITRTGMKAADSLKEDDDET